MSDPEVRVSDDDIKAVETQIKAKANDERTALEANIRKEFAAEQKAKELESQLAAAQKAAEDARTEAAKAKQEAESVVKAQAEARLKAEQEAARSKAPISTTNPFSKGAETKPRFTPEDVQSIDRASYEAFLEKRSKR